MYNYSVDFSRLATLLLPAHLRAAVMHAYTQVLAIQFSSIHQTFIAYAEDLQPRIDCNSQVCKLRARLNALFDADQKRITIKDGSRLGFSFVYERGGDNTTFTQTRASLTPWYVHSRTSSQGEDFRIILNDGLELSQLNKIRLKAVVENYKTAGKTHNYQNVGI